MMNLIKRNVAAAAAVLLIAAILAFGQVTGGTLVAQQSQHLDCATQVSHAHAAGTITITPPAGNQFVYITGLDIMNAQGSAVTPAAPTFITTTNLSGGPQFMLASGPATAGTGSPMSSFNFGPGGLKSNAAGTAVTFVVPAFVTNQTVSINIYYYFSL